MISSFVLSMREGLEAALIIGIVLGTLHRTNRTDLVRPLWAGVSIAVLLSLVAALVLRIIGLELEGTAEQVYEGLTFLLAASVLTWMVFFMLRQSRNIKLNLEAHTSRTASLGGKSGIFILAFIAVLREGVELGLYLVASSLATGGTATLVGTSLGLLAAITLGFLLYTASIRLNLQCFFQFTGVLFILFAAGMVAHSIAEFSEAGLIPGPVTPLWNTSHLLDDHSAVGSVLSTLFGYNASPSLAIVLGYCAYVLAILVFFIKARKVPTS